MTMGDPSRRILYPIKGVLAFCSIVYELLLAQTMSVFLPHTVLNYCLTIGLYLFSLGLGAWCADTKRFENAAVSLLSLELVLAVVGGFSVVMLHLLGSRSLPLSVFMASALGLVVAIGLLTGLELPLLIRLSSSASGRREDIMLAWDYAGAVAGSIVFAAVFYSRIGLIGSAFLTGLINAAAGILLACEPGWRQSRQVRRPRFLVAGYCLVVAVLGVCLLNAGAIDRYLMDVYIM